jgi:cobalamin biosynthesis Mg chelatase CobN
METNLSCNGSSQDKPRQAKTSQAKTSQDKPRQAKTSQDKPRQAKTRQAKTRQDKLRQAKPRQAEHLSKADLLFSFIVHLVRLITCSWVLAS